MLNFPMLHPDCTEEAARQMKGRDSGSLRVIWSIVKDIPHLQKGWEQYSQGLK